MIASGITFRAATPSRWKDLEALFGERGACGGCWCMFWRLPRKEWLGGKGEQNKRSLARLVADGKRPGILAYDGREPVGWCAVAPRQAYVALERSRVLKAVDDTEVWSISCLFVRRSHRRRGLSTQLIAAAVNWAGKQGARVVEAYPIEPAMEKTPDAFVWLGVPSAYSRAGFKVVARRSAKRPIMRRVLRAS